MRSKQGRAVAFDDLAGTDLLKAEESQARPVDPSTRLAVEGALNHIPEAQKQVLELSYYEGMTHEEIAARLEIPLGTVKTRLRAGLKHLRDYMNSQEST
jgi:RNA polymerase sigma-70 factor, ECF subfamily